MKSYSTAYPGLSTTASAEPRQRVDDLFLNVARQTHRQAVDVDLASVDTLRLEENLVPLLVRKADDLVLERRAISGADSRESDH